MPVVLHAELTDQKYNLNDKKAEDSEYISEVEHRH